jgi:hypothetical protein
VAQEAAWFAGARGGRGGASLTGESSRGRESQRDVV